MSLLDQGELRERIERLAAIERGSGSPGEREAAELIGAELEQYGARVSLDEERVHGTYWWPIGLLCGLAALVGLGRRRARGLLAGAFAAAAVIDDTTGGGQWFRRALLPKRPGVNVVASIGPEDASRTIVFVAHHDAAHSGLVFHPALPRALARRFPEAWAKQNTTPGTMWGAVAGPALVALGSLLGLRSARVVGALLSAGYTAAMVDIGVRRVVPGANDNLTAVAVLLSLARSLREDPVDGVRVLLVSTASEESFMEGMQAFGRRHFPSLPTESTTFVTVETVGSPRLATLEGEGMMWMNEYPKDLIALTRECGEELGIELVRDLRLRNATDGLIALRAGYPSLVLGSVDEYKLPANYHWPTDTPENVDYGSVAAAARLMRRLLERWSRLEPAGAAEGPVQAAAHDEHH